MTEKKHKEVIFQWQDGWGEYKTERRVVKNNEDDFE